MSNYRPHPQHSIERGFAMLEVALALVLLSAAFTFAINVYWKYQDGRRAQNQASVLNMVRSAAETLVMEHYADFQAGLPITRNGVTLQFGDQPEQALRPTVAQLNSMALGLNTAQTPFYKSLSEGSYVINIQRIPINCETSPNGVECNITGLACFDQTLIDPRRRNDEAMDSFAIGKMLDQLGANGGASILDDGSVIFGFGGAWEEPNPVDGEPSGIVCARFGFGSAGFGNFLRVRDSRDPQFQNNVSLGGGLNIQRSANMGDACSPDEDNLIVPGLVNGVAAVLQCDGSQFVPLAGIEYAVEGNACDASDNDRFAIDQDTSVALICSDELWVRKNGRRVVEMAYYEHGSIVELPDCSIGHSPVAVASIVAAESVGGANAGSSNNTGLVQVTIDADMVVKITGSDSSQAGSNPSALVITSCDR